MALESQLSGQGTSQSHRLDTVICCFQASAATHSHIYQPGKRCAGGMDPTFKSHRIAVVSSTSPDKLPSLGRPAIHARLSIHAAEGISRCRRRLPRRLIDRFEPRYPAPGWPLLTAGDKYEFASDGENRGPARGSRAPRASAGRRHSAVLLSCGGWLARLGHPTLLREMDLSRLRPSAAPLPPAWR